jgi:hypothetical protein
MKTTLRSFTLVLALAVGMVVVPAARAECGYSPSPQKGGASLLPQSWQGSGFGTVSFLLASDQQAGIVGMWKVAFTAKGNADIPDGAPIDNALIVYHSDGTEIMNSGRPPQDGNFCMGVWVKTGWHRFKVNHFAGGNDTTNAPTGIGNPTGPTHITEKIWLSPDTNSFAGTFVLDATDPAGNPTAHIIGVLTATRITINTNSVF